MNSIIKTCVPRSSILTGTFNPEIFTASLGPVIDHYKGRVVHTDKVYTDAEVFFREATYPTEGLKNTVSSVFRRIAGDATAPSIYRLETAFGGGKTHNLIACVHIANCGKNLAGITDNILDPKYLPDPGTVSVVGIAGDEIPVAEVKGDKLIPYTLWGELAYQIGGEALYNKVRSDAESLASPGLPFLDTVLGDRKILILFDELAQYAARLEAAHANGAEQLAGFLMLLNGYASNHSGIAIIVTLAGTMDAFASQTGKLTELLNSVSNTELSADDAVAIAEKAAAGTTSVVMRHATGVTPVTAAEISSVLGKRLFESIDQAAAQEAADAYHAMYVRNQSMLPADSVSLGYQDRIRGTYPFHPSLVDFLNNKLATSENFQGTRGVLRVLAMTVRGIWTRKAPVSMIHISDIDMQNDATVNEILGRTGSSDLIPVLNADIGASGTHRLQGGVSNAQRLDLENPHPDNIPLYEMTWKTIFLNSLVGRSMGIASNVFGVTEREAIFQTATPIATPPQVQTALEAISDYAYYLRFDSGKYYAGINPTINSVLARIRSTITDNQIRAHLRAVSNNLLKEGNIFHIENDVRSPQDIPDGKEKPCIAVISLDAGEVKPLEMFTTVGEAKPRIRQNTAVLLVPKTVRVHMIGEEVKLLDHSAENESWKTVETIARQVIAISTLENNPQNYGISPAKLKEAGFRDKKAERELALQTVVTGMYSVLLYPSTGSNVVRKDIKAVSDEGGSVIVGKILDAMKEKLLTENSLDLSSLTVLRDRYFLIPGAMDFCRIDDLYKHLLEYRSWPMLAGKDVLDKVIREGVARNLWVLYRMGNDAGAAVPEEIYTQENHVPFNKDIFGAGYSIVTVAGAKQRGWTKKDRVDPADIQKAIRETLSYGGAKTVGEIKDAVSNKFDGVEGDDVKAQIQSLIQGTDYSLYQGKADQKEKPSSFVNGFGAAMYGANDNDVIISRAEQGERGWLSAGSHALRITGNENASRLMGILRRIGSIYTRQGSEMKLDALDISGLQLANGGTLRISLEDVGPKDVKTLDELFQIMSEIADVTDETDIDLEIKEPKKDDPLIKELEKQDGK